MIRVPSSPGPPSRSPGDAQALARALQSARLAVLLGPMLPARTALLAQAVLPLLHPGGGLPGQRELFHFFERWGEAPACAEFVAAAASDHVRAISRRHDDAPVLFVLDNLERLIEGAQHGADQRRCLDALASAVREPRHPAHFLVAVDAPAWPQLRALLGGDAGLQAELFHMPAQVTKPPRRDGAAVREAAADFGASIDELVSRVAHSARRGRPVEDDFTAALDAIVSRVSSAARAAEPARKAEPAESGPAAPPVQDPATKPPATQPAESGQPAEAVRPAEKAREAELQRLTQALAEARAAAAQEARARQAAEAAANAAQAEQRAEAERRAAAQQEAEAARRAEAARAAQEERLAQALAAAEAAAARERQAREVAAKVAAETAAHAASERESAQAQRRAEAQRSAEAARRAEGVRRAEEQRLAQALAAAEAAAARERQAREAAEAAAAAAQAEGRAAAGRLAAAAQQAEAGRRTAELQLARALAVAQEVAARDARAREDAAAVEAAAGRSGTAAGPAPDRPARSLRTTALVGAAALLLSVVAAWSWWARAPVEPGAAGAVPDTPRAAAPTAPGPASAPAVAAAPVRPAPADPGGRYELPVGAPGDARARIARELAAALANEPARTNVVTVAGDTNLLATLQAPQRLGIVGYDTLRAAREGTGPALRVLSPLFPQELVFIVRADAPLRYIHDLRDRRVGIGGAGNGAADTVRAVYRRLFGSEMAPPARLDRDQALAELVAFRSIDALAIVEPQPSEWWTTLDPKTRGRLRLLALDPRHAADRLLLQAPGLSVARVAAPGSKDRRTATPAVMSFLVVSGEGGADAEPLQDLADALCSGLPQLRRSGHAKWRALQPAARLDTGWPVVGAFQATLTRCARG